MSRDGSPAVLVVAGLDPTGGAGLAADAEAIRWAGAQPWLVAAALTAQGPRGARGAFPVPPEVLLAQVDALLEDARPRAVKIGQTAPRAGKVGPTAPRAVKIGRTAPRAVKIGMIGSAENARALGERLSRVRAPVVVDPVLAASSGLSLVEGGAAALAPLLAGAALATPNWPELEALAGRALATEEEAIRAARELPARAVLVKGGHREGPPVDLLVRARTVTRFGGRRRPGTARGTGCRLASAIAGLLARGEALDDAVRRAKRYVERYLDRA